MKIAAYPLATFTKALELAKAVDDLGNNCAHATCAAKMNKKISGGFKDLISSAVKYGLITNKRGILSLTDGYNNYKLSYTSEEADTHKKKLFLTLPLFQEIFTKYKDVGLPTADILEKALVREFGVPEKFSTRTAHYFTNGAKFTGLLNDQNKFRIPTDGSTSQQENVKVDSMPQTKNPVISSQEYSIEVMGQNTNIKLPLKDESDFLIVDAMLSKVKKSLGLDDKESKEHENPKSSD